MQHELKKTLGVLHECVSGTMVGVRKRMPHARQSSALRAFWAQSRIAQESGEAELKILRAHFAIDFKEARGRLRSRCAAKAAVQQRPLC